MHRTFPLALSALSLLLTACSDKSDSTTPVQNSARTSAGSQAEAVKASEQIIPAEQSLSAHSRALFEWFDTLDVPNLDDRKYLRIYLGTYRSTWDVKEKPHYAYAFLLDSTDTEKLVFTFGMSTESFTRDEYNMLSGEPYRYQEFDLRVDVIERLEELRALNRQEVHHKLEADRTDEPVALFILARGCFGNGFKQQAEDLISYLAELPDLRTGKPVGLVGIKNLLSEDMASSDLAATLQAFSEPTMSRERLRQRFLEITTRYPQSTSAIQARESAAILTRMIVEDNAHAQATIKPLAQMTPREQVAELIYQLRDQKAENGIRVGPWNGGIYSFNQVLYKGSPATQLVNLGDVALEQLIDAVDDDSFTRCGSSHRVFRVGECCQKIIDRIQPTGRMFDVAGNPQRAKAAMKVWYLGN
ncbi:hypothetical protein Enr10x_09060 [Gimesia panareensis]|uniref:DUF4375 domain-containing protein n=1 Tax=Gimesia panareensis TaxID=2527978 RepID=A0A517Q1V3_9PLAN|nr:hypothetical protein [Gimesia panareensis]QDT25609.1 hypothetical protein Enr10x_09060 [Gimesia panareensis]